jgi:4-aminobutyrate aminotransferase-like enzyme
MSGFQDGLVIQREKMGITPKAIAEKIKRAPYGKRSRELARKWVEVESYGSVGMALFDAPPIIERGKGAHLYDADGNEYLDFLSGFSVSNLGACNDEIVKIIHEQSKKLIHDFDFPHPERIKLADKLVRLSRIKAKTRVAFGVTGSDGIELAVRAARYYTGKPYILTAYGDYHGNTYGTMGLTSKGGMQPSFYPVSPVHSVGHFHFPYCYRCPFDKSYSNCGMYCMKSLEKLLESKESPFGDGINNISSVAAVLVEPYQSSAAYYIPPVEYLKELRRITERFAMLLMVDEIQCGLGRSGKLWSFEHSGIEPDVIITSKSLGGGLPLSAVVAKSEILTQWGPGAHVSTQAGNAIACAAGNYVLDMVSSSSFLEKVNETGAYFLECLKELEEKHKIIGDISNKGIYTGIELVRNRMTKQPAIEEGAFIRNRLVEERLLFEKGGYYHNRMQFIPPLNIEKGDLKRAQMILDKVFSEAEKRFNIR